MRPPAAAATNADWSATFRADVEGLRGLAVVPVLLYHAAVPGWAGGYVGVDVFFVLSGYLITGLLLRELAATGRIGLAGFYARRSRRILPAAGLVLVATVAASALLLPPLRLRAIAIDGVLAALFSANVHFALRAADYFQAELPPSPLIHYWSLGVEEQFYLLWPAVVLLVGRRAGAVRRTGLVAGAVVGLRSRRPPPHRDGPAVGVLPAADARLGARPGALLAVGERRGAALPARVVAVAGWVGVALVAAAVAWFGPSTPFPGTAALVPTAGALLLLAAGARPARLAPGRLLSTPLPRFFGRISYSLYLWSWPLVAIPTGMSDRPLSLSARLALAAAAIPLAVLSQQLVEQPLRRGRLIGTAPRRNLALAGASSLAVVAVSLAAYGWAWLALGGGRGAPALGAPAALVPQLRGPLPADVRPSLASVRDDTTRSYRDRCHLDPFATRGAECAYGAPASPVAVVLFGDSHAGHWFPALDRIATARGWRLLARTKTACSAADVPVWNYFINRAYPECAEWRENVLREIEARPPALVVIGGARTVAVLADGAVIQGEPRERAWAAGLERTIRRIAATGAKVALLLDTPRPAGDAPACLSGHRDDVRACATSRAAAIDERWRARERAIGTAAGATVVDPTDWVCPVDPCPAVISSRLVFRDNHHLSTPFAELLAPRLAAALPAIP
ncbi:MAG: acyltransferase family protein [Candidatus Binatia bacterium]